MNKYLVQIIYLIIILTSCQKREWTNPFDPNCPKEIWTPTDFKAVQEGTTVKLTWNQPINQISGFKLAKSIDGGTPTSLPDQAKGIDQFIDITLIGGKIHSYSLTAFAGNSLSNTVTVQIMPLFVSSISATKIITVKAFATSLSTTISNDGGAPITAKGICWSTSQNPTLSNSKTNDGTGAGSFISSLTGLSPITTYYARSYATNSVGTVYGTQVSFTTYYGEVTDIDGNIYQTVKIGNQIWMAENLKTTKFRDGTAITLVTDNTAWANLTTPGYCWYNNDATANKNVYGALYNWYAVIPNKLAPTGWHVPTDNEWEQLAIFVNEIKGPFNKIDDDWIGVGKYLKATSGWNNNDLGTDEFGFSGNGGGNRPTLSIFREIGTNGSWWSATLYDGSNAWRRFLEYNSTNFNRYIGLNDEGFSVRCIYGDLQLPTVTSTSISGITLTSAVSGGNVISDGGTAIIASGVCWSRVHNPTIADSKTTNGTGSGSFTSSIAGLSPGTTYYVRAYATNGAGTAYGSQISFTTIANQITPIFTTIGPLCQNSTPPVLPTSSTNTPAIAGTWNPATINTATTGTSSYTFTPTTGQNASTASMDVKINAAIYPTFPVINNPLCQNSVAPILPTTSTNGITGTWIPSSINTAISGGNGFTFTPAAGQCSTIGMIDVYIAPSITPLFTVIGPLIQYSTAPALPLASTNGITGTWLPSAISTSIAGTVRYTFTPNAGQCTSVVTMDILTTPLTVTDIDGNVYNTVTIGTQVWMVENLKTTRYRNGDAIPNVTDATAWTTLTTGAYCSYNNNAATYKATYGGLYNWYTVSDSRIIAPVGWHVPTDSEWTTLTTFIGGESIAGGKLKETGTTNWASSNSVATNEFGFTAVPGGSRLDDGLFYDIGSFGYWWSSTEYSTTSSWYRNMGYNNSNVNKVIHRKQNGFSVRCLRD